MQSLRPAALAACVLFAFSPVAGCLFGEVAFTTDGKRFAVVLQGERALALDDAAENPRQKDHYELWVTERTSGKHVRVARGPALGFAPAWSSDGQSLYYLEARGGEAILRRWDGERTHDAGTFALDGDGAVFVNVAPQLLPAGGAIVTRWTEEGTASVLLVGGGSGGVEVLAEHAGGAVLAPDRKRLALLAWTAEQPKQVFLEVMSAAGGARQRIAKLRERLADVSFSPLCWSPDGGRIAWVDGREGEERAEWFEVYATDVEKPEPRRVSAPEDKAFLPVFAPDGRSLYYAAIQDEPYRVRCVDLATGTVADVASSEGCVPAGFTPDGKVLAMRRFAGGEGDASVVRLLTLATGEVEDDWLSPYQHLSFARAEIAAAREHEKASEHELRASALARAEERLQALDAQFPEESSHAERLGLRAELEALRATK